MSREIRPVANLSGVEHRLPTFRHRLDANSSVSASLFAEPGYQTGKTGLKDIADHALGHQAGEPKS
jgi:hypothetical protein